MARYARDYDDRGFAEHPRDASRRWYGEERGRFDPRSDYRARGWYDRDFGWHADGGYAEPDPWRHGPERPRGWGREMDYRGGYGGQWEAYEPEYPPRRGWEGRPRGRWDRPFRDLGAEDFDHGAGYGAYGGGFGGGELFRGGRGGGFAPGRYFRGYGIGSGGSYEPY